MFIKNVKSIFCTSLVFTSLFSSSLVFAQVSDNKLELSGFSRVVLGYFDDTTNQYLGYDDSLNFSEQSLIALQADYQFSSQLSATAQVIGFTGGERKSGIEWLYLTYQPNRFIKVKVGKQRTPFFNYSDVIDVGFAYPWVTLPQQVYNGLFFSTFDGVLSSYETKVGYTAVNLEAFWGRFEGDIPVEGAELSADVKSLRGVILTLNYDNFNFRTAYHRADSDAEIGDLTEFNSFLSQIGFIDLAESLTPDGELDFFQVGLSYDNLNFFLRGEFISTTPENNVVAEVNSFYTTIGYNYFPYTTYLSYAKAHVSNNLPDNTIPLGINSTLDTVSFQLDAILDGLTLFDSSSITLGTRWDWKPNLAMKAEVTWIREETDLPNQTTNISDQFTPLYQLSLEWIF